MPTWPRSFRMPPQSCSENHAPMCTLWKHASPILPSSSVRSVTALPVHAPFRDVLRIGIAPPFDACTPSSIVQSCSFHVELDRFSFIQFRPFSRPQVRDTNEFAKVLLSHTKAQRTPRKIKQFHQVILTFLVSLVRNAASCRIIQHSLREEREGGYLLIVRRHTD